MDGKSGYILSGSSSSMSSVSSPSDCSIIGAGETGKAPGSAWDGDKIVGLCLLEGTERLLEEGPVEEVDQLIDDERLEKMVPKNEELADESDSVVVVVVVERELSTSLGEDRAGFNGGCCWISSTSKGVSTVSRVNAGLVRTSFWALDTHRAYTHSTGSRCRWYSPCFVVARILFDPRVASVSASVSALSFSAVAQWKGKLGYDHHHHYRNHRNGFLNLGYL